MKYSPGQVPPARRSPARVSGLSDALGRSIDSLRISVTDRCNLRCVYCMPEDGMSWLPREHLLTFEEIDRVVRIFSGLGVRRIRLTGGEPLVRSDLAVLVRRLRDIPGIADIGLTTNGVLLGRHAAALAEAGLDRVNVSLDSLVSDVFRRIVRRDALEQVLEGLEAASRHLAGPVKVNTVLVRGLNDGEILSFAELARRPNFEVRFIEFMPLDADRSWSLDRIVSGADVRSAIHARHAIEPDPAGDPSAPSQDWVFRDRVGGKIGFIDSVTQPFCDRCNRVRLTAEGKLRTCLFSVRETDLRALLRDAGFHDEEARERAIGATIRDAVWRKEPGHRINRPDFVPASRSMSQIGG